MRTTYNHLSDKELTKLVASKENATELEVELMQRIDHLLDLVELLEEDVMGVVDTDAVDELEAAA